MGPVGGTPGPIQPIGAAQFVVTANTAQFTQGLQQAQTQATQFNHVVTTQMHQSGRGAAQGLLALSQAIDDVQYGFRSIVNNIPQVVMMMGGSAGIAGAVGIAAVAVNQFINHWDELKATLEGSDVFQEHSESIKEWGQTVENTVSSAVKQFLEFTRVTKTMRILGFTEAGSAVGKAEAKQKAEGTAAREALEKSPILSKEAEERIKLFKEAIKEYGGSEKLQQDLAERLQNRMPGVDPTKIAGFAAQMIQEGLKGGTIPAQDFGSKFEKSYEKALWAVEQKKQDKIAHELTQKGAEAEKATKEEFRKEHDAKMQALEDQAHNLEVQRERLQEQIHNRPHFERFEGTKAMVDAMQSKALNDVPKQQLATLKNIETGIKNVHEEMVKERRNFARFS